MPAKRRYSEARALDRLRRLCEGQSFSELGRLTSTHRKTVRRFLAGRNKPSAQFVAALCAAKGVSADWLLLGRDDPQALRALKQSGRAEVKAADVARLTDRAGAVAARVERLATGIVAGELARVREEVRLRGDSRERGRP